jgi:hypothetical protein
MALTDMLRPARDVKPDKVVEERMKRGRARMAQGASKRNECLAFHRGDQYVHQGRHGNLIAVPTVNGPGGKPNHRVRLVNNLIVDVVAQEVSAATQRVPSYSITPSTMDPEDIGAARLSEKVAVYGYDQWRLRQITERVVAYAVIADEGFAWPYFDNTVGDRISDEVATGELRVRVFGPNEVYWEPGIPFEDSRWFCVEQGRPLSEVKLLPGFMGGKLDADAKSSDVLEENQKGADLVLVTEYLERPSIANPDGRRVVMANGKVIVPEEPYPLVDPKGHRVDEPVLHRLGYFMDPSSDRSLGLVRFLLDPQRTINDCYNKLLEWKNLALAPQVMAAKGTFAPGMKLTDEPGAIFEYEPNGQAPPTWRPTPAVPRELFDIATQQEGRMGRIAAQNAIPSGVDAGKAISVLIEKDAARRQAFIANLADFHSRLMRHCLYLVQRHYTEGRLLSIRGRFGPELTQDFLGAQLMGQADVTVMPDSIEPRTKQSMEQKIMNFAQLGWITPEAAMAAINSGTSQGLIESYELDISRANLIIQKIRANAEQMMAESGTTESPDGQVQTPDWMPREFDNTKVQMQVFGDWMKTVDFDSLGKPQKAVAQLYYQGLKKLQSQHDSEAAAAQAATAQAMGDANAARTPGPPQLPSLPVAA